jgi:cell division protein FtsB
MKKPSKQWVEFGQLIDIIDIRVGKQQRKLVKLKKEKQALVAQIQTLWDKIEQEQIVLKTLGLRDENNALQRLFLRREDCKSYIESFFFDVSIKQQKVETLTLEIETTEAKKKQLEKRKDALGELRELIRDEEP